jgi:putative hydrolase of the HAD superfamily
MTDAPSRPPLRAVVFDWGGTLTEPLEPLLGRADLWAEAARKLLPEREEELVERLIATEEELWRISRDEHRSSRLADLFARAAQELGIEVAEKLADVERGHLANYAPHVSHDPDAIPVLRALRERGLRIGLLSNTLWPGSFHDSLLERDGLVDLLDGRLYTSEMELTKPHPDAFMAILDRIGVDDPSAAAFVGDRLWDDIFGAKRAGLRAVHRPRDTVPHYDVEPDAVIQSLPDLLPLVDRWRGVRGLPS